MNFVLPEYNPDLIVIPNYSDKSHAIFGDITNDKYVAFVKDHLSNRKTHCIYNNKLLFGPGWIVYKNKMDEIIKNMHEEKLKFIAFTKEEYETMYPEKVRRKELKGVFGCRRFDIFISFWRT